MTATITPPQAQSFADLTDHQRKDCLYYGMDCHFKLKSKLQKGKILGAKGGKILVGYKNGLSEELNPKQVFIEKLREPLKPGKEIKPIYGTAAHEKFNKTKVTLKQVRPIYQAETEEGIEIDPNPFEWHQPLPPMWEVEQRRKETASLSPIAIASKVRRNRGERTEETGEVIEWSPEKEKVLVRWLDKTSWVNPEGLDIIEIEEPSTEKSDRPDSNEPSSLAISDIKRDGGTQTRAAINSETVSNYAEDYTRDGIEALPPIIVFYDGSNYWLADGFHRVAAVEKAQTYHSIQAIVKQGTRRDAQLHSLGANAQHGLPRSRADKRRAIELMLRDTEWKGWSDRSIAKHCKVSDKTVAKIRKELYPPKPGEKEKRTFLRNGKQHEATVRKTPEEAFEEPETTEPVIAAPSAPPPKTPESREEAFERPEPPEPPGEVAAQQVQQKAPESRPTQATQPPGKEANYSIDTPRQPPASMQKSSDDLGLADTAELAKINAKALTYWEKIQDLNQEDPAVKKAFRKILATKLLP